jgi:hypothetical protein
MTTGLMPVWMAADRPNAESVVARATPAAVLVWTNWRRVKVWDMRPPETPPCYQTPDW